VRLEFVYKRLTDGTNHQHFLLTGAVLSLKASMQNGQTVDVPVQRVANGFIANLTPQLIPEQLMRLEAIYRVDRVFDGRSFKLLEINQTFTPVPVQTTAVATATYVLTPGGWRDALQRQRLSNLATHPLLDLAKLAVGRIVLNVAMLDLSEAWAHLHRQNGRYQRYAIRSEGSGLTFKVFAFLGGNPLIWYCIVPNHLHGVAEISPHVFFSAADNAIAQPAPDKEYLSWNADRFKNLDDGLELIRYITPPIEDTKFEELKPKLLAAALARNVVSFDFHRDKNNAPTSIITPRHFTIGAGFQKAFMHVGGGKPAQFLLLPQRNGSTGWAITPDLKAETDAVIDVLQTNTELLSGASDTLVKKGKMVLSCYSESGVDLWYASRANQSNVKAIVAIEPQNLNSLRGNDYRKRDPKSNELVDPKQPPAPLGKDVIPNLLKQNVKVFLIGRHGNGQHYRPLVPDISKIRLLPRDPITIFAYPPNPAANDFIKYRVQRMVDPGIDPFMTAEEWAVMLRLASRRLFGLDALAAIMRPESNRDDPDDPTVDQWYSHHFALTGGDEMTLNPNGLYGKPITYRTFFQVAVHEIG
jgi:hypothetical protein